MVILTHYTQETLWQSINHVNLHKDSTLNENIDEVKFNMKYDPELALNLGFDADETLAYQLLCLWIDMRYKIIPDYIHTKIPKNCKNLKKTLIFKQMKKFVIENRHRFKGLQYILFMQAQLDILGKLHKEGKPVLIEASVLCGENADKRWAVWKKLLQDANKITKITYEFVSSNLEFELRETLSSVKEMCKNNLAFEKFEKEAAVLLKYAILKKLSPIYVILSPWVKKLPEQVQNDLADILNLSAYKDFDMKNAIKVFEKYFSHEISMS